MLLRSQEGLPETGWQNKVASVKRKFVDAERLTAQQFRKAFQKIRPRLGDHYRKMLQANYSATNQTISATQMAKVLGYQDYRGACNYGTLAKMMCKELGYPKDHVRVHLLVRVTRPSDEWLWTMRPQVAKALEELGLVNEAEAIMPQTEAEALPERIKATVSRIIRDTDAARSLKSRYHFSCQVCGLQIQAAHGCYYIEVHHIRPLGGGHDGMDEHSNMLVLCPNHHAMFDLWIPQFLSPKRIAIGQEEFQLESQHTLSPKVISYYNKFREERAI